MRRKYVGDRRIAAREKSMNNRDWNKLAKKFESHVCDITATEVSKTVPALVGSAHIPKSKAVLVDLGCGIGTFIRRYGARFDQIFGVDFADRILERAKQNQTRNMLPKVTWMAKDLPSAAAEIGPQADLTVCLNVITSANSTTRRRLWQGVAAVTKPKGFALVGVPALESARMVHGYEQKAKSKNPGVLRKTLLNRAGATQKHFSESELRATFGRHGFELRKLARVYVPWAEEGMEKPKDANGDKPFDWLCLAQRI
jgi:SAM-dependent methyltransferase